MTPRSPLPAVPRPVRPSSQPAKRKGIPLSPLAQKMLHDSIEEVAPICLPTKVRREFMSTRLRHAFTSIVTFIKWLLACVAS